MVEVCFHWAVQVRSVCKSIYRCSFKAGTSTKITDPYCPSLWHHSTRKPRWGDGKKSIRERSDDSLDSPQWGALKTCCFSGYKVDAWQHVFHQWSYWWVTLQQGHCTHEAEADVTSKHWTNFTRSGRTISTVACRAGLNWTAYWK